MEKPRLLLVEDESIIARDLSQSLGTMGYQVVGIETTGKSAIDTATRERPSLVLMDIELQGHMDGIEAATIIRSTLNIPIIYLTAYADDRMLERARMTGPFGYLIKPFDDRELHFTIQMALYKHSLDEEVRRSKEQFQALVENTNAIPWKLDLEEKRFIYMGPQIERLLGYRPEEIQDYETWTNAIHEEDREDAVRFCEESRLKGGNYEFEFRIKARDSRIVWVRNIVTVIETAGKPVMLQGVLLDITLRKEAELEREKLIIELQDALGKIKTLKGLLPICAWCKKVRDDNGYWKQVEQYVSEHSDAEFTHGMCPDCQHDMEKELRDSRKKK
jgi:PAS domain S-box-containing protein